MTATKLPGKAIPVAVENAGGEILTYATGRVFTPDRIYGERGASVGLIYLEKIGCRNA